MKMKSKRPAAIVFAMFFMLCLFLGVSNGGDIPDTALAKEYERGAIIDVSQLEEGDYIPGDSMFYDGLGRTIYPICHIDGKVKKLNIYADYENKKTYKVFTDKEKRNDYIYTGIRIKETSLTTYVYLDFKPSPEDGSLAGSMFSLGYGVWIILAGVVAAAAVVVFLIVRKKRKIESSSED